MKPTHPRPVDREAFRTILQHHFSGLRENLEAWLLSFYQAMHEDLMIGYFFEGKDLALIARRQSEFIWKASGLTESYKGKAPATAHLELAPILRGHFDRRLVILRQMLAKKGLSSTEVETWITFEEAFRASIVST